MKLIKKMRKGFTLIELVVVIAVIAILSAVSVVSYIAITNKAKQSNDHSLIDQVNTSLTTHNITKKINTMHEALEAVEDDGFIPANFKISPEYKDYTFAYNIKDNQFVILDKKMSVTYPKDADKSAKEYDLWLFADETSFPENQKAYSHYLRGENLAGSVTTEAGLDVGKNTGISSITYSTNLEKNVVFRTNGGTLTINAENSHVEHYNLIDKTDVQAVSGSTYVENGTAIELKVASGQKVKIEKTAVVVELDSQSTEVTSTGYVASVKAGSVELKSGSVGSDSIKVSTAEQLQGLARASTAGKEVVNGKTIQLQNDIDLTGKQWIPFGLGYDRSYSGTFDGNGHKIIGLSNKQTNASDLPEFVPTSSGVRGKMFGLIAVACAEDNTSLTIKNLTMVDVDIDDNKFKCAAALVGSFGDKGDESGAKNVSATFENVVVKGKLRGLDKVAGFIGGASHNGSNASTACQGHTILVKNCTNEADIEVIQNNNNVRAAGFVGQFGDGRPDGDHTSPLSITFENCVNKGTIKVPAVSQGLAYYGAFLGHFNKNLAVNSITATVTGCTNSGTLIHPENNCQEF